jgi:tetratricopeptide (TPR) repeat protein
VTEFVGAARQQFVEDLLEAYGDVVAGIGPRMVVLSAPSGEGKTRIVQEFYRRLAAAQPAPHYWPEALADDVDWKTGRKQLRVPTFSPEAKAEMPWLYWSVSCSRRPDGTLAHALSSDVDQFGAHADYLFGRLGAKDAAERGFDSASAVVGMLGILGLAFPPVAIGVSIVSATKTAIHNRDLIQRFWQWRLRREEGRGGTRVIDAASHGHQSEAEELADDVVKVSLRVPIIIAVDDAHWTDEFTVHFLDQVLRQKRARILFVVTTWPRDPDDERLSPFTTWVATLQIAPEGRRVEVREVEALENADLVALVHSTYGAYVAEGDSALDDEVVALLVQRFATPMGVRAFFDLKKVQSQIHHGGIELRHLEDLPDTLAKIADAYWEELPDEVRSVLAIAATHGERFASAPVVTAAEALDQPDATHQLERGKKPYGVTRDLAESLQAFTDFLFHQTARVQSEGEFAEHQLKVIYDAVAAYATSLDPDTTPATLAATVWSTHVAICENDERDLVDKDMAAQSAWHLAELSARTYAYADAIRHGNLALTWSAEPKDSEGNLGRRCGIAFWLGESGKLSDAITLLGGLREDQLAAFGPDDPRVLSTRHELATWLGDAGQLNEAIALFEALLEDRIRVLGADHFETLGSRSNLAILLGKVGRLDLAISMYMELLEVQIRVQGRDHIETLASRNNLASFLGDAGRLDEAIIMFEVLLEDQARVLGLSHPDAIATRDNLANDLDNAGRLDEALTMSENAVRDFSRALGPNHPEVLSARSNLASRIGRSGRTLEALAMTEGVVADCVRILGDDHPLTMSVESNLANRLLDVGRTDEAVDIEEMVLVNRVRLLGPSHPDTLTSRNKLAIALLRNRKAVEAIEMYKSLVEDRLRVLGPDHPDTLTSKNDLAIAYGHAHVYDKCIEMSKDVLQGRLRILGPGNLGTISSRSDLAFWLSQVDRFEEAITENEDVLRERLRIFGPDHPDTLGTQNSLAVNLANAGHGEEGIEHAQAAVDGRTRIGGTESESTVAARETLAFCLAKAGRLGEARAEYTSLIADCRRVFGDSHETTKIAVANFAEFFPPDDGVLGGVAAP